MTAARSAASCMAALALLSGGCGLLDSKVAAPLAFYRLDSRVPAAMVTGAPRTRAMVPAPLLTVMPTRAAPGFDSSHIVYFRDPRRLKRFAYSEWVDTPARMLAPLIVATRENSEIFGGVALSNNSMAGELILETDIRQLQQDFSQPTSRVHFTLRASLIDRATRRMVAWREFNQTVAATSDDPRGGVLAANQAAQQVMDELAQFCDEVTAAWLQTTKAAE